jgi:hypothetical protein
MAMRVTISDPGTAATLWGYDGFYLWLGDDETFYVILNRGKVIVEK